MKKEILSIFFVLCFIPVMAANYSIDFDGSNDRVSIGTPSILRPTSAITVEAWVKASTSTQWDGIVCNLQDNSSDESGYGLFFYDSSFKVYWWVVTGSAGSDKSVSTVIPYNTWTHIAGTYDGSTIKIYENGILISSLPVSGSINYTYTPIDFAIGSYYDNNEDNNLNGLIDDVRVWNYARSQNQIASTMRNELKGNETGLIGYWRLNEGSGTNVDDLTSYGNDGTLINSPYWSSSVPVIAQHDYLSYVNFPVSTSSALSSSSYTEESDGLAMKYYSGGGFSGTEYYSIACNQSSSTSTSNLTGGVDRIASQFWDLKDNANDAVYMKFDLDDFCPDLYDSELEYNDYKLLRYSGGYWYTVTSGSAINGHVITFNAVTPIATRYTIGKDNDDAVVITSSVTNVMQTTASCGGNVTSDGGGIVTARGVCWNTTGSPTISDTKTVDGSGTGSFTSSITELSPGTTYYVRAYATNSEGTFYGSQTSFTTNAATISFIDGNEFTSSITPGNTNQVFGRFQLSADVNGGTLTDASFLLNGARSGATNFKLWASSDLIYDESDTQVGTTIAEDPGDAQNLTFDSFTQSITTSATTFFLSCDLAADAAGSIQAFVTENSSLSFTKAQLSGTINNAALSGSDNPLPVTLSSFYVTFNGEESLLQWETQSEDNNQGWNVYRNLHCELENALQINYELLPGAGNSIEPQQYSFEDVYNLYPDTQYYYWLESVSVFGDTEIYGPVSITIPDLTENPDSPPIPITYGLANYPNPFNPSTQISFALTKSGSVELNIYSLKGRKVKTLVSDEYFEKDVNHIVLWDGTDNTGKPVCGGIYLYKLISEDENYCRKMLMLK